MRVGIGLDFHRFAKGRKLVLGGVVIPYGKGLVGHSDADVLLHAICDALLGATGLGDIGTHFPASDPKYKNISSLILLKRVKGMLGKKGAAIGQIDAVVVAEEPPMAPYFAKMKEAIAQALEVSTEQINLKATRAEGLGALGRGEGIMAQAVASLKT